MKFQQETIAAARADGLEEMQRAHWREVASDQDAIPLSIDWSRYDEIEKSGILKSLTMRTDDGVLAGYNAFFVLPHLHYSTSIFAVNDVLYVSPGYRGIDGIRFILHTERRWLPQFDVAKIIYHSKREVIFGAGARGEGRADSLDLMEQVIEIEQEFGLAELDDEIASPDLTLGGLLERLGYSKFETTYGKLLRAGA